MAKKTTNEVGEPQLVSIADMMADAAAKKFGKRVLTATELETRRFGIEPYPIAFQWLIHCNILPMQSIITLSGPPKTYKTSGVLEFARWFIDPAIGGVCWYLDNEGKISPSKVRALTGEQFNLVRIQPCQTTQEWQEAASFYLTKLQEYRTKIAEGREAKKSDYKDKFIPPHLLIVDSLTGNQDESMQELIAKQGHGGQVFDQRPKLNTQWLSSWGSNLVGLPVTVAIVQHLKTGIGGMPGVDTKVTPGGVAAGFHTSLEIRVSTVKGNLQRAGADGARLQ